MSSFAAMVSSGGRVFYIMDHGSPSSIFFPSEWKLVARDGYNGVVLWSQPSDEWVTQFGVKNIDADAAIHGGATLDARTIINGRIGVKNIDPTTMHWDLNHWVRGTCIYGVMPANGLTYAPQHPCACYPESKLSGMNALAANQEYSLNPERNVVRLMKGPGYDVPLDDATAATPDNWPCLRGNISRTSYTNSTLTGARACLVDGSRRRLNQSDCRRRHRSLACSIVNSTPPGTVFVLRHL